MGSGLKRGFFLFIFYKSLFKRHDIQNNTIQNKTNRHEQQSYQYINAKTSEPGGLINIKC